MEQCYESDLTEVQWLSIRDFVEAKVGRKATVDRRRIVNAIFYVAHTGCQWRNLPHDFPNWHTVYSCYSRWMWNGVLDKLHEVLRDQVRLAAKHSTKPTAGSVDSQSVKGVSKGGTALSYNAAMTGQNG